MNSQPSAIATESQTVSLVVRRTIRAEIERVFEAWTRPEHLEKWWGPKNVTCPRAEVDLRPGGSYRIANRHPDGHIVWITGEFELVAPPHKLVYTWRLGPDSQTSERVTVRFEPQGKETEVIVIHERVADAASRDAHERGWHDCIDGLVEHLNAA